MWMLRMLFYKTLLEQKIVATKLEWPQLLGKEVNGKVHFCYNQFPPFYCLIVSKNSVEAQAAV